jgi:hypothetical protein
MTIRSSALMTAGLLGALMILGTYTAHADDGCTKDKKSSATATHWGPIETLASLQSRARTV